MEQKINFESLKKNLMDVIEESQIKLGYAKTSIGLYYPLDSLNRLLDADLSIEEMQDALLEFSKSAKESLGDISCTHEGTRFCITVPEEGVAYVHQETGDHHFLKEFIRQTETCNCSIDAIVQIFKRYSDKVVCRKIDNGEFDYLIYFEDGNPDEYRYCIKFEGSHVIYHRFTPKDYEAFAF